ncbi:MAG: hypothetical protein AB7D92_12200 [Sphaerochaeta sp.]
MTRNTDYPEVSRLGIGDVLILVMNMGLISMLSTIPTDIRVSA